MENCERTQLSFGIKLTKVLVAKMKAKVLGIFGTSTVENKFSNDSAVNKNNCIPMIYYND